MILSVVILTVSVGLFLFYLQEACERILRREFDREFFHAVVNANRLESPSRWDTTTWFHAVSLVLLMAHLILHLVRS